MALFRSGLVLFVLTTALATLIATLLFFGVMWKDGWHAFWKYATWHAQGLSVVTAPTCVWLMLAAWRGRRRPILDGVVLASTLGFAICGTLYLLATNSADRLGASYAGLWWAAFVGGWLSVIPAYLITYFALRRTPLLSPLAPPRKTKGPAEASP